MARTFTNEPVGASGRHEVAVGNGRRYLMRPSWIDTTSPCDMMDWDFTDSFEGLRAAHEETRQLWVSDQVRLSTGLSEYLRKEAA